MLVEFGLVEQRYRAVLEVLNDGATVTDMARRYEVPVPGVVPPRHPSVRQCPWTRRRFARPQSNRAIQVS